MERAQYQMTILLLLYYYDSERIYNITLQKGQDFVSKFSSNIEDVIPHLCTLIEEQSCHFPSFGNSVRASSS